MDTAEPSGAATGPGNESGEAAFARTHDLRASLEAIVSEAERVSEQLVAESRATAAATTREADDRAAEILDQARTAADVIRTRAESDVEEYRRRVRVEVVEQVRAELGEQNRLELASVRAQSQAVIGDLEAGVRILGVSMESAVANIAEMLAALEELRSHNLDPLPQARPLATETLLETPPSEPRAATDDPLGDPIVEPAFGQPAPLSSVPAQPSAFDSAGAEADRPMTASQAFLNASSFETQAPGRAEAPEIGDPPVSDSRPPSPEDPDAGQAKPLGWLFRSPD